MCYTHAKYIFFIQPTYEIPMKIPMFYIWYTDIVHRRIPKEFQLLHPYT